MEHKTVWLSANPEFDFGLNSQYLMSDNVYYVNLDLTGVFFNLMRGCRSIYLPRKIISQKHGK